LGSKLSSRKIDKCPICGKLGYLFLEKRTKKQNREPTLRGLWEKYQKKFPNLHGHQILLKIEKERLIHFRNTPHKKYESALRKRHPYRRVVHNIKVKGKWKTKKCYLGVITRKLKQ